MKIKVSKEDFWELVKKASSYLIQLKERVFTKVMVFILTDKKKISPSIITAISDLKANILSQEQRTVTINDQNRLTLQQQPKHLNQDDAKLSIEDVTRTNDFTIMQALGFNETTISKYVYIVNTEDSIDNINLKEQFYRELMIRILPSVTNNAIIKMHIGLLSIIEILDSDKITEELLKSLINLQQIEQTALDALPKQLPTENILSIKLIISFSKSLEKQFQNKIEELNSSSSQDSLVIDSSKYELLQELASTTPVPVDIYSQELLFIPNTNKERMEQVNRIQKLLKKLMSENHEQKELIVKIQTHLNSYIENQTISLLEKKTLHAKISKILREAFIDEDLSHLIKTLTA